MEDYKKGLIEELDKKIAEARSLSADPSMAQLAQTEITELERQKEALVSEGKPKQNSEGQDDTLDQRDAILEVKGAAGGEEAKLWADQLSRMYSKFLEKKGLKVEKVDDNVVRVSGKDGGDSPFKLLKYEAGVHRVQRIPDTEKRGRIHTSTATVSVLPELEDIDLHINPADITFEAYRAGGHGGQNVNKVSTAVRIKHIPSGIVVTAQTERFQAQNREIAMELLRAKLWEIEVEKQNSESLSLKSTQVGRGQRAEKIRTYNFPQDRLTDHRVNKSWHNIEKIMDGELDGVMDFFKTNS